MKKIVYAVLAVIIAIGIIVIATVGFNVDVIYSNHREIKVYVGKDYNIDEVRQIVNEVIPKERVVINKQEKFNDSFIIKVNKISDEQLETLKQKLIEKYEISEENKDNAITIAEIGSLRIRDLVRPYVLPIIISTLVILAYMCIRYKKLGIAKVIMQEIIVLAIAGALLLSIIAITRCPVNRMFIPSMLTVYVLTIIATNIQFTKQLENLKSKEEKKA
ncbi:MAG TPA: hypothetical protein DCZ30_04970 [Clostridiales bacterium]|nr:hypothetical protein [Clostridiales bacterium]